MKEEPGRAKEKAAGPNSASHGKKENSFAPHAQKDGRRCQVSGHLPYLLVGFDKAKNAGEA
jgi:hypothetical protein